MTLHVLTVGATGTHCAFQPWQGGEEQIDVQVPDDAWLVAARGKVTLCRPGGQSWEASRVLQACDQEINGYRRLGRPVEETR